MEYKEEIEKLKKQKNAVILAHVYQREEVQDIADFIGDSLDLSKKAVSTDAEIIVFCGVKFMAETAAILNPDKTVLLPVESAGCELADTAEAERLREKKKDFPDAAVVSYINSSAEIKAESDICCTSANAVEVVKSLKSRILFLPDKNLGTYAAKRTGRKIGRDIILWDGYCYVHEENIDVKKIEALRHLHPDAEVMVHPECSANVMEIADYIGSTSRMLRYAKETKAKELIVGTEDGLLHQLQKENPDKTFYPVETICENMKKIHLKDVRDALKKIQYKIEVPEDTRKRAKNALARMLLVK
jgi:quinolinate synthase